MTLIALAACYSDLGDAAPQVCVVVQTCDLKRIFCRNCNCRLGSIVAEGVDYSRGCAPLPPLPLLMLLLLLLLPTLPSLTAHRLFTAPLTLK